MLLSELVEVVSQQIVSSIEFAGEEYIVSHSELDYDHETDEDLIVVHAESHDGTPITVVLLDEEFDSCDNEQFVIDDMFEPCLIRLVPNWRDLK